MWNVARINTHLFLYLSFMAIPFVCADYKRLCSPFCLDFLSSVKGLVNDLKPRSWPVLCWTVPVPLLLHLTARSSQHVSAQPWGKYWEALWGGGVAAAGVNFCPPHQRGFSCDGGTDSSARAPAWWQHIDRVSLETNDTWNKIPLGCVAIELQFPFCFTTINNSYIIYTK